MSAPGEPPSLNVRRLIEVLDRHGVEYMLVGGVAAQAHGARRPTKDFDCLVRRTTANFGRLADAMHELNARFRSEQLTDEEAAELPVVFDALMFERLEISTWRTDAGDIDILADIPDRDGRRRSYEELAARADQLNLAGIVVQVAALDDVIASKEWADRPKDRDALPELQRIARAARGGDAPNPSEG